VGERTVYLSGDIAEPAEAAQQGARADIAVVELAHFEPEELGAALSGSGVKCLVLTHLLASLEPIEAEIPDRVVAGGYEGEIVVAHDGMDLEL
jgi:ribonuclease BN (tRNA processing enzyme)